MPPRKPSKLITLHQIFQKIYCFPEQLKICILHFVCVLVKKEEPYSPTKDMAEYTRLTCERKIKEDEVRSRVVLYKCLKVGQ